MQRIPPFRAALVALLALAAVVAGTFTATAATPPAPVPAFTESFSSATWYTSWGRTTRPWRTTVRKEGGNSFLRVGIPKGEHDGTSFFKGTGDHESVTMRYRIRFGAGFDPSKSRHNVKLPGFGQPLLAADGVCLAGCGGAAADGIRGYSARVDIHDTGVPGFYVYDVNPVPLAYGRGIRWNAPRFQTGRWYTVEVGIAMNAVGRTNGVLKAKVDGRTVFERGDLNLRTVPTLKVGAAWFDVYYGGAGVAPADTTIDIDDVQLFAGVL